MRIGELARRTGVSERSPRYYETQGLLAAERTRGGHRDHPEPAVDRVIRIQELYAAGLHSQRIRQLLRCMRDQDGGPSASATPRPVEDLTAERARIDRTSSSARPATADRRTPERPTHQEAPVPPVRP
ncbi:MerR family transcriptional regulator [Streptomyces lasalocidi]